MRPAYDSTPIQSGFRSVLLLLCLQFFAINAWATPIFTNQKALENMPCQSLLAGEISLLFSEESKQFLVLVNLGIQHLVNEQLVLHEALAQALQSQKPTNPFLKLGSQLGHALKFMAEPLIKVIPDAEWVLIQNQLSVILDHSTQNVKERALDTQKTASLGNFEFIDYMQLARSAGLKEINWLHLKLKHLGRTSTGHSVILVQSATKRAANDFLGVISIPEHVSPVQDSDIQWIIKYSPEIRSTTGGSEFSTGYPAKVWVIKGRLYAAIKSLEESLEESLDDKESLVELDPATGLIIDRLQLPSDEKVTFWEVPKGQIVTVSKNMRVRGPPVISRYDVRTKTLITIVLDLKDVYKDDMQSHVFDGIDSLAWSNNSFEKSYMTDLTQVYENVSRRYIEYTEVRTMSFVKWSTSEVYSTNTKVSGPHFVLEFTILESYRVVSQGDRPGSADLEEAQYRKFSIPLNLPMASHSLGRVSVFSVPNSNLNIVYVNESLDHDQIYGIWLVDRQTLEATQLPVPEVAGLVPSLQTYAKMGALCWLKHNSSQGQHILIGNTCGGFPTHENEQIYLWVLDPDQKQFVGPVISDGPNVGIPGNCIYSEDGRAIIGRNMEKGIVLLQYKKLRREAVE